MLPCDNNGGSLQAAGFAADKSLGRVVQLVNSEVGKLDISTSQELNWIILRMCKGLGDVGTVHAGLKSVREQRNSDESCDDVLRCLW